MLVCVCVCLHAMGSWSGSHIRWGQPFRLRHLTTGHYLALTEDKGLVLQDREKSDTASTAFCFRASKVFDITSVRTADMIPLCLKDCITVPQKLLLNLDI